ncbi:hypothetical protein KEM48_010099 [Puccinia striiformis f. sp. tritici PST-130]|nr:hypothetical protein KEM48_010099 [Puccinia striiformis f. sp. tritici PST-130]
MRQKSPQDPAVSEAFSTNRGGEYPERHLQLNPGGEQTQDSGGPKGAEDIMYPDPSNRILAGFGSRVILTLASFCPEPTTTTETAELDSNKELYLTRYVVEDPLLQRIYSQYDEDSKLLEKLADRQRTKRTGTSARQKSAHSQSSQYRKFTPAKGWGASPEPPPIIVQLPPRFGNEIKGLITDALKVLSLEEKKRSETGAKIAHYALVFLDITNLRKGERNQLNKLIIEHLVEHLDTDFINSFDVFQKIFNDLRKFW